MPKPRMGAVSMRNVWLIARREYVERIRTKGFMLTTIMIPVIMCGFIGGSIFLGSKGPSEVHIAVVSPDSRNWRWICRRSWSGCGG